MTTQETTAAAITTFRNKIHLVIGKDRTPICILAGPWIDGVNPDLVKIKPMNSSRFPKFVRLHFYSIENNSDSRTDYFEADCIRLLPGDPLWQQAKELA